MKFLTVFFTSFYKSLYDLRWLKEQRKEPNKAWTYFFMLMLFIVFIISITMLWSLPRHAREAFENAKSNIPEFEANIKDGELILTGFEQPYIYEDYEDGEIFSIYVDTNLTDKINVQDVFADEVDTGVLITRYDVTVYEQGGLQTRALSFKDADDFTLTKHKAITWGDRFIKTILPFLIPLFGFLALLFWSAGKLIYLLLISLIVWIASIFGKKDWDYNEVYTVGLYAMTLPTLLGIFLQIFNVQAPFLYSAVLFVLMIGAVFVKRNKR